MLKIAVSSQGPTLDSLVDTRFGRASYLLVVDAESEDFLALDNAACKAMVQGAGIKAAESVVAAGARVVMSGYVGPKAFTVLKVAKIDVVQDLEEGLTVRQAVRRHLDGRWSAGGAGQ